MPTITKLAGCGARLGQIWLSAIPRAPAPQPPMTIDGPKTPPEPPLPIVRLVVTILPSATAMSTPAVRCASLVHHILQSRHRHHVPAHQQHPLAVSLDSRVPRRRDIILARGVRVAQ